jgi:uncharacterized protein (TIGR02996 family)
MSTEKSLEDLLKNVIAEPDDDSPRLAYADAIERSGADDRAEFIRLQCSLERMEPDHPAREDARKRERDLLQQHGWEWAEPLGNDVNEWLYRRGFIERVGMHTEGNADAIRRVFNRAPVRHIRDIGQLCELEAMVDVLPLCDRLTGLEFWGLYAVDNNLLWKLLRSPYLKNLQTLILHHDRNGNLIDEDVLIRAMNSPHRWNLRELGVNVDGTWRGPSIGILHAMAASPFLRNLRKVHWSNAGITGNRPGLNLETVRLIGQSRNFAKLREIDLGGTSCSLEVWDELLTWPFLPDLEWLRLSGARQITPPSMLTVATLSNLTNYRFAFEQKAKSVDWITNCVSPYEGETCWHGQSWK